MLLRTVDVCTESIDDVLRRAGIASADVDFLCMHQGTAWLKRAVQEHAGLAHVRTIETFHATAHLHAALVPSDLVAAERSGMIVADDVVLIVGGGTGMAYGATLLRWGT
jgi:3-oxoacyl-[acyl-carrier-protein] synthase-3